MTAPTTGYLEAYLEACQFSWASSDIRAMSTHYLNETLTADRAASKAYTIEQELLNLPPNTAGIVRGNCKRRLRIALARWWAAIVRETEPSRGDDPRRPPTRPPLVLQRDIDERNAARKRARMMVKVREQEERIKPVLTKLKEAKDAADVALLAYRHAHDVWERALLQVRRERPTGCAPKWTTAAAQEALRVLREARADRRALQMEVQRLRSSLRVWKHRAGGGDIT